MSAAPLHDEEESFSFLEFAIAMAKHKLLILLLPLSFVALAGAWTYTRPDIFTAKVLLVPPQAQQTTGASLLAQFGGAAANVMGGFGGLRNNGEIYLGMMRSRTVADEVVRRLDLSKKLNMSADQTQMLISGKLQASMTKENLIEVIFTDADPKNAALIANTVVEEFGHLIANLAVTDASQRRQYYEKQLVQIRANLAKAELAAKQALGSKGLTNIDAQGRSLVETAARLRGQKSALEIRISVLKGYAAADNPELKKAQSEMAAIDTQLAKIEGNGNPEAPTESANSGFDTLRLLRDLKFHETVNEAITKQYEVARLDEAKEFASIQVIDWAVPPTIKSGPRRLAIMLAALFTGLLLAVLWALLLEKIARSKESELTQSRLKTLRSLLGRGR